MPNFGYRWARVEGANFRRAYRASLSFLPRPVVREESVLPFEVYTYSSEVMLPEQIASLRSLLRYAGRPSRITIVSDGSHPSRSLDLLRRLDPSVVVMRAAELPLVDVPSRLQDYLTRHPTGKQMSLIMSPPARGPALYLDAEVRFFPGGRGPTAEAERSRGPGGRPLGRHISSGGGPEALKIRFMDTSCLPYAEQ